MTCLLFVGSASSINASRQWPGYADKHRSTNVAGLFGPLRISFAKSPDIIRGFYKLGARDALAARGCGEFAILVKPIRFGCLSRSDDGNRTAYSAWEFIGLFI